MVDRKWVEKINEIKQICTDASLPIDVEIDSNPYGIDAVLQLGDIPFTKDGDLYTIDFEVNLIFSVSEKNWNVLIERLELLSQKLSNDQRFIFNGWTRILDRESKLEYQGTIRIPGRVNTDLIS